MADNGAMKSAGRKAYMFRHQAAGILTSHVFLSRPTEAQMAPMRAECERLHGAAHPKTGDAYWTEVVEVPLLESEAPSFPKREAGGGSKENAAGAPKVAVSGVGAVVNPGEK